MEFLSSTSPSTGLFEQLLAMGGPVMGVLIAMAVIGSVAFVYLMLVGTLLAPRTTGPLKHAIRQWQATQEPSVAKRLQADCRGLRGMNPLNHLVLAVMNGRLNNESPERVQETVSQNAQRALTPFEAPLKIIEVIAALAPLLGLLGTVLGMMEAFSTMAASEGRASATQLSGGIYQALTTTAAGLIVAIPLAAIAAWIEFRLRRLQATMNTVLFDTLTAAPQADAPAATTNRPARAQAAPTTAEVYDDSESSWQGHQAINAVR